MRLLVSASCKCGFVMNSVTILYPAYNEEEGIPAVGGIIDRRAVEVAEEVGNRIVNSNSGGN